MSHPNYIEDLEAPKKRKKFLLELFRLGFICKATELEGSMEDFLIANSNLVFSSDERLKYDEKQAFHSELEAVETALEKHEKLIDYPYH